MAAYVCHEDGGGCGAVFTPNGDKRPRRLHALEWRWCPDCLKGQETAV